MLDPKLLKENPQILRSMLENRKFEFPIDDLEELSAEKIC